MSDFDDLLETVDGQGRFEVPVRLLLDAKAYARSNELNDQIERLRDPVLSGDDDITVEDSVSEAQRLATEMAELHKQHPPAEFRFRQLSADEWADLETKHPKGDRGRDDPFWIDAMGLSCVAPDGSDAEKFKKLRGMLSAGQWELLRAGCEAACWGSFSLTPTRAATAILRGMRQNSIFATASSE